MAHLHLTALVVRDYDRAIDFFVNTLQFELGEDAPSSTNDGRSKRWVVVRPRGGETGILLARADGSQQEAAVGQQFAGRVGFFLRVDDFDTAYARMQAAGVAFTTTPRTEPYGRVVVFLDCEGNKWDLLGPVSAPDEPQTTAAQIIAVERAALDRWGGGDPGGFLDLYGEGITYFDPTTAARIDGHPAAAAHYEPWIGKIHIDRYELLQPHVVVTGDMALLTYNLVNYHRDAAGVESVGSRWNSTTVFQRQQGRWRSIHSHWSFTRHAAFQNLSAEASERQGGQG